MPKKHDYRGAIIQECATILQAIEAINNGGYQLAAVVGLGDKLLGVVTDGDIRRALLSQHGLDTPVASIMNSKPVFSRADEDRDVLFSRMQRASIHQIPLVNQQGVLVGIITLDEFLVPEQNSNTVILLAGGQGKRLMPLTESCPKPLLKLGGRPLLESIIINFRTQGFSNFVISLNYLGEMIRNYFGDGRSLNVEIDYIEECEPLGTAGPLSLLPPQKRPVIVMNGDLLTKVNFRSLLEFHKRKAASATVCAREYEVLVPYGVMRTEAGYLTHVIEKPRQNFLVSAGIYVLEPDALSAIPSKQYFDMPELLDVLVKQGNRPAVFPIYEYWLDVGQPSDFYQANEEFSRIFID